MTLSCFVVLTVLTVLSQVSSTPRVSQTLLDKLQNGPQNIMVIVGESTTSKVIAEVETYRFTDSGEKTEVMVSRLRKVTSERQAPILLEISKYKSSSEVKSFYIADRISVRNASPSLVEKLASRNDIEEIREAKVLQIFTPTFIEEYDDELEFQPTMNAEWGIETVGALDAWAQGTNGSGIIVANIDTGVRYTHEALRDNYREDYGWFDPYYRTPMPNDQNGHGTHTMGTIAGAGGIGVAPGATWIACKGCDFFGCYEEDLFDCGQWVFCPTLPDGSGEDCSMRPHICSNSWGGGQNDDFYKPVIDAWRAADIIPIFAIGNSGSNCQTANSPGDRADVISVGATDSNDTVALFSSRGLSSEGVKPECAAPGVNVRSSVSSGDSAYASYSGTSMAAPHAAGVVALLLQNNPDLNFHQILEILVNSASRQDQYSAVCPNGIDTDYPWPNNEYGGGRIHAGDAMEYINATAQLSNNLLN